MAGSDELGGVGWTGNLCGGSSVIRDYEHLLPEDYTSDFLSAQQARADRADMELVQRGKWDAAVIAVLIASKPGERVTSERVEAYFREKK